jgi:di/tricarboxylate transporter
VLRAGDLLFVDGSAADLQELLRMQELEVQQTELSQIPAVMRGVGGLRARLIDETPVSGRTLRDLRFRDRFGLVVVAVERHGEIHRDHLGSIVLAEGDEIYALGNHEQIEKFTKSTSFEIVEIGLRAIRHLLDQLHLLTIPDDSPLIGATIGSSRLGELTGITVAGLVRGGETRLVVPTDEILQVGDQLLIGAVPSRLTAIEGFGQIELESTSAQTPLESEEVGMVEAAIAPRSSVVGRTLAELDFQDRYGLVVLAIWRGGKPIQTDFAHLPLQFGDALLLHGPREKIRRLAAEPDFVVLSQEDQAVRRTSKAKWAFACLGLMIALVAGGIFPIHAAAFIAASLVILSGSITMPEVYRAIEWKAIFLVAAVLPVGLAMERTGAALLMANTVAQVAGPIGNYATLAALIVLASMLSQGLDGAPSVVLLAPVVIQTATSLGISPYPLMMGVSLAASAAFMTPFSHKANLLVMGAGGYRSVDYLRVGTPLTIVLIALMVILVPVFFPF